jgi:hypothetical protein
VAVLETKKKDGLLHNQKRLMTGRKRTNHEIHKIKCLKPNFGGNLFGGGEKSIGDSFCCVIT